MISLRVILGPVVALLALAFWAFCRCWHRHPLALLPPTTNPDGSRSTARWYCDACGKSWPAEFDHTARPVKKFDGYDQSKASAAAKRQAELERRLTRSAVTRSGVTPARRREPKAPIPFRKDGTR